MAENRGQADVVRRSPLPTFDQRERFRNKRHAQIGHIPRQKNSSTRLQHRPRFHSMPGGPGMQAIFLDSSKRSCGTGVFLPLRAVTDFRPNKKPACSPVLLPSRVVQTLNLNVHELKLQARPPRDTTTSINRKANVNKKGNKDTSTQHCCVVSNNCNISPEIFLPKEWTY